MVKYNLDFIVKTLSAELKGDPLCVIDRAEPLASATAGAISFLTHARYFPHLAHTQASAVIIKAEDVEQCPTNAIIVANPELAFAKVLEILYPKLKPDAGIHPTAIIGENCQIDSTASIGPYCVLEEGVKIGAYSIIKAGTIIGAYSQIGENCLIYSRVTIYHQIKIGDRVIIHSGAVIGADGFGLAHDGRQWVKIPQVGAVELHNDVEIGANTTVDRGALKNTVVAKGVKIDNLVQVAHNVRIGEHTAIAGCTGIAGSTEIGRFCMIGGGVSINGHIKLCDGVVLTGTTVIRQSLTEPGIYSSGVDALKNSTWRRNVIRFNQLDDIAKRLRRLEQQAGGVT